MKYTDVSKDDYIIEQIEKDWETICRKAEEYVLWRIQEICTEEKLYFKTVYGIYVSKKGINRGFEEEIEHKQIYSLVKWYEDRFGIFGMYVCKKGKWINGQTPLIVFNKPEFKMLQNL